MEDGSYLHLTVSPYTVDGSGSGTDKINTLIGATSKAANPPTVYYKFKALDGSNDTTTSSPPLSFTDTVNCGLKIPPEVHDHHFTCSKVR